MTSASRSGQSSPRSSPALGPRPASPPPPRPGTRPAGLLLTAVACCGASLATQAEFDSEKYLVYPAGPVTLRPQLEIAEVYDSNLFYAEEGAVDDFYTSIRPGLFAVYGERSANFFSLRYTLDASVYLDRDDLNNVGNLVGHQSRFQLSRVQLQANDSFSITKALLGGTFSYIQKRIGMVTLNDLWRADYEISPKALVGVKALFDYINYDASDLGEYHLYDYMAYGGGARFGYLPSEKIVLFPEVTASLTALDPNKSTVPDASDLTSVGITLGAEGDFTPKLTGVITAGYEFREYADGSEIPDGWIAEAQLRWQARPKTSFSLGFRHWIQVSREAVAYAFDADRVTVGATQELGTQGRWSLYLSGYYQLDSYDRDFVFGGVPVDRSDDLAGVTFRASYRWQPWITFSGGYEFYTYGDNVPSIPDYDVHRLSLRMVAGY
jgi:hypothetical protein